MAKNSTEFSSKTLQASVQWNDNFRLLRGKNTKYCRVKILYLGRIFLKNKDKLCCTPETNTG